MEEPVILKTPADLSHKRNLLQIYRKPLCFRVSINFIENLKPATFSSSNIKTPYKYMGIFASIFLITKLILLINCSLLKTIEAFYFHPLIFIGHQ